MKEAEYRREYVRVENGSIMVETDKQLESVGGEVKNRSNSKDGRSFKEVVEGLSQNSKIDGWVKKDNDILRSSRAGE